MTFAESVRTRVISGACRCLARKPAGKLVRIQFGQSSGLTDVCPRPKYTPNGEERAWGRRLARRFGCDGRYDDRSFRLEAHERPELVLDARAVKAGGRVAAELIGEVDPARGEAVIAYGWAMAEALADGLSKR